MKVILGNMFLDILVIAIAVGTVLIIIGHPVGFWGLVGLGATLALYAWVHTLLTLKRMGYKIRYEG